QRLAALPARRPPADAGRHGRVLQSGVGAAAGREREAGVDRLYEDAMNAWKSYAIAGACIATAGCTDSPPEVTPAGAEESTKTRVLEAGAKLLQTDAPLGPMDVYLVGF